MSARLILTLSLLAASLSSQETRFNPFTGKQDYVASFYWKAVGAGVLASRPATCTANKDMYICNGVGCTAGNNIHYCTATDTWTTQGGTGDVTDVGDCASGACFKSGGTGGLLFFAQTAAPGSPAASNQNVWVDSTDARLHDKNPAGTIGTTVVADTGSSNNFLTAVSAAGVISKAQPSFTNISGTATVAQLPTSVGKGTWGIVLDGGGSAITTGVKGEIQIPYACTITEWTILLDQSGSIVIDIWKDTYANYPPTVADTITASAKPTVTTATKNTSTTLTGWTTSVTAGDTIRFNVDSITTATRATLLVYCTKG